MRIPPMNRNFLVQGALVCGLVFAAGHAAVAQVIPHQDFVCVYGASRRIVSVFNLDSPVGSQQQGGCRVEYTKDGATTTLYTSKSGRAYCAAKAASLVTVLEKGNYSCRAEMVEKPEDTELPTTVHRLTTEAPPVGCRGRIRSRPSASDLLNTTCVSEWTGRAGIGREYG